MRVLCWTIVSNTDNPVENYTVTVVVGRTARADVSKRRVRRWLERITDRGARAKGFIRADIQAPELGRLDEWLVVYEFSSRVTLSTWLDLPNGWSWSLGSRVFLRARRANRCSPPPIR